jgi:hypothetical protein
MDSGYDSEKDRGTLSTAEKAIRLGNWEAKNLKKLRKTGG